MKLCMKAASECFLRSYIIWFDNVACLLSVQAVPLADCKDSVVGAVLKVLLHSLSLNQSTTFLSHTFATFRALVIKVLSLRLIDMCVFLSC